MDNPHIRIDDPSTQATYPGERDKKGYARFTHKSKRYHLGRYGTPESYATFALWSAELARTGEALDMASIKPYVKEFLAGRPSAQPMYTRKWFAGSIVAAATILGLCVTLAGHLASRVQPPKVDGIAMSKNEILRIQIGRKYDATNDARRATPESVAFRRDLEERLKRGGAKSVPLPELPEELRRLAKPQMPDIPTGNDGRSRDGGKPDKVSSDGE